VVAETARIADQIVELDLLDQIPVEMTEIVDQEAVTIRISCQTEVMDKPKETLRRMK